MAITDFEELLETGREQPRRRGTCQEKELEQEKELLWQMGKGCSIYGCGAIWASGVAGWLGLSHF